MNFLALDDIRAFSCWFIQNRNFLVLAYIRAFSHCMIHSQCCFFLASHFFTPKVFLFSISLLFVSINIKNPFGYFKLRHTIVYRVFSQPWLALSLGRLLSLSTVVLNSRDRYEKLWLPDFWHFENPPYNRL